MSITQITPRELELETELHALKRESRQIRRLLCLAVADRPYMDDGEASDQEIDYLREPSESIERKMRQRNLRKFQEVSDCSGPIDALIAENNLLRDLIAMANGNTERAVAELAELKSQEPAWKENELESMFGMQHKAYYLAAGAQAAHDEFVSDMLTKWKTGMICGQDAMILLFRHYSSNPAAPAPVQAGAQPAPTESCRLCGADTPFTGSCGGGRNNPKALCYESAPVQAGAQPEAVKWGVDWGTHGDRTCVSIVKQHVDGTLEVVATEYQP